MFTVIVGFAIAGLGIAIAVKKITEMTKK